MDIAAEKLEALINLAENTLDSIEFQLQADLTKQAGTQLNPAHILRAIEESRNELDAMKKEKDALIGAQEEIKEKLTKKLQLVCKQLQDMGKKMGAENNLSSNAGSVMKSHLKM